MTNPIHPAVARHIAESLRRRTGLGWDTPENGGDGWRIQGSERDEAVFVRLEAGRLRMRGAFPASTYMLINVGISIHTRDYLVTVDAGRNAASQILVRAWVAKRRPAYLAAMARVREAFDREEAYEQQTEATRARLLEITGSNPDATRQGGYIYHTHMRCTSNLSVCVVPECGEPVAERGACEGQWCPEHWAEHTREYPACAALYWAAVKASEW